MKPRDRTKLPVWAQREIARLERDVAYLREKLSAGPAESNTFADPYRMAIRPLGIDPTIEFHLSDGIRIRARLEGDEIDVGSDSTEVYIRPRASNRVRIGARGR